MTNNDLSKNASNNIQLPPQAISATILETPIIPPAAQRGGNVNTNFVIERHPSLKIEKGDYLDRCIMAIFFIVFMSFTLVILVGDAWFLPEDPLDWCRPAVLQQQGLLVEKEYSNIDAVQDPCYYHRTMYLLGFSPFECDFGRRMICSVILGAAIGWERKAADRPAGIRTMSLVSLGSATFTMGGQFAFRSSTMGWDAARVSAAIPSGVGFLGSALIWKEATGQGANRRNHVHGIATAASVWLSASIGIGVGGALYVMSIWTVVLVLFVLRLVPKLILDEYDTMSKADEAEEEEEDEEEELEGENVDIPLLNDVIEMQKELNRLRSSLRVQQVPDLSECDDMTEEERKKYLASSSFSDTERVYNVSSHGGTGSISSRNNSLRQRGPKHLRCSQRRQKTQRPSFHSD